MAICDGDEVTIGGSILLKAKPNPLSLEMARTVILVVDMQNDFGTKGGMFDRAGIDISMIQRAVEPTARVLAAGRKAGLNVIYLKMAYRPDLSDAGLPDSPNWIKLSRLEVGKAVQAPDGSESRILIRDTWNSDIVSELRPETEDTLIYKTRFSGFYQTELDTTLKRMGAKNVIVTGCTTSICVESTIRDGFFLDYACILLEDCTAEPSGSGFVRSNHEASLHIIQSAFGWVSNSDEFVSSLEAVPTVVTKE